MLILFAVKVFPQQKSSVDFKTAEGTLSFFPEEQRVQGEISYRFTVLRNIDTIALDAKNMKVELAPGDTLKPKLINTTKKIYFLYPFKSNQTYAIKIIYEVEEPKQALYFSNWHSDNPQIWSQGQGKENSHWLPSIDDANDKIKFTIRYSVPKGYRAIGNGTLVKHVVQEDEEIWHYQMHHPISSYLVAVAVGKYQKKEIHSTKGIPITLYYEQKFQKYLEPTYRYTQRIFDFLETEIGIDYPFTNYKLVPVRDFMYAGMENATTTLFSESFFTDSIGFIDRNFVNVNAHELAHQWFGDDVTEKSSKDHWLQEGFAAYYALLAEKEIFGEDYFYFKLYQSAEKLKSNSDQGKGQALLNPKANALTFYEKGAWALHILREKVGEEAFKNGIRSFLQTHAYQNASVNDFMEQMMKSSGQDLTSFTDQWLKQSAFQDEDALASLKKSTFITAYMEVIRLRPLSLSAKYDLLLKALEFPTNPYIGQEVVQQLIAENPSEQRLKLLEKAFETNQTMIRQTLAESLVKIPKELQKAYESLLKDPSYRTQEEALLNLWLNFPEDRSRYLDRLQHTQGFYTKNIRMLWLTLSIVTTGYQSDQKEAHYRELSHYTAPQYDYAIRENAFGLLYQINRFTTENYKNLLQASLHPAWQFQKFSKALLKELLKEEVHRENLNSLKPELNAQEVKVLNHYLSK